MNAPVILAHAGGVDEILVLAVPVLFYLGVRWWGRRRDGEQGEPGEG